MRHLLRRQGKNVSALAVGMAMWVAISAQAGYVVNTGQPPNDIDPTTWPTARYASDQFLAANFTLSGNATVTGVEGWMSVPPGGNGRGRISIYNDIGLSPGSVLLTTTFDAPITDAVEPLYSHAEWIGALGLNWSLAAGSYWVAFEADPGGVVAGFILGAPNQLGAEAYSQGSARPWARNDALGLGVRVQGTVPEPSTFALAILSLGVCVRLSRKHALTPVSAADA